MTCPQVPPVSGPFWGPPAGPSYGQVAVENFATVGKGVIMGFDIYGRNPTSEVGVYIRFSCWAWRPLLYLIGETSCDLLDRKAFAALGSNDGEGPTTQHVCDDIASRLERFLAHSNETEFTQIQRTPTVQWISRRTTNSPYGVTRDDIEEFIEFLRNCGGFYVIQLAFVALNFSLAFFNTPWHRVRAAARNSLSNSLTSMGLQLHAICAQGISS